jgi:DNA-binding protein HU-beta
MANKADLIEQLSQKLPHSKKELSVFVDTFIEELLYCLEREGRVSLAPLGVFLVKQVPPRTARNPQTGQPILIPAKKRPIFRAGKAMKDQLNK